MLKCRERKGLLPKFILCVTLFCMLFLMDQATLPVMASAKISLNQTAYVLKKGSSYQLTPTILKSKYKNRSIEWSSSKKSIVSVSSKGLVQAKKKGKATITAKIKGTSYKAKCKITVGYPVTKLDASLSANVLYTGEQVKISTQITPAKASNKNLSFESSNSKIAKVSSKGKVTAVAPGSVSITVRTKDGSNLSATFHLTVKKVVKAVTTSSLAGARTTKMMSFVSAYSTFIKKNSSLCYKNGSSAVASYELAKKKATAKAKIALNCASPVNWALKEMGILSSSGNLYGSPKGFKNSSARKQLAKYGSFISTGSAMGLSVQAASDAGAILYGDVLSLSISGLNHTVIYAGRSSDGKALVYEAGGIAASLGYGKCGCGPLDYSKVSNSKNVYKITEIYRLK